MLCTSLPAGFWKDGTARALATPGELYGVAAYINQQGQAVGASGTCSQFNVNSGLYLEEIHAMFWDSNGQPYNCPASVEQEELPETTRAASTTSVKQWAIQS